MTKTECLEKFDMDIACQMMKEGKNQTEIGNRFGISSQRVSDCFNYYNIK